jgi:hypothetical protein
MANGRVPGGWNRIHLVIEDPSGHLIELFQPNPDAYIAPGSSTRSSDR